MERFQALLQFLEQDPDNITLIGDAASAAFDANELETAQSLVSRYKSLSEMPLSLVNLEGLIALRMGALDVAASAFDSLLGSGVDDPAVRFNRAWVHALNEEHEAALVLLDDDIIAVNERAASLKVQTLHHLGQIEEALAVGQGMVSQQ
jgi:Flp pilus assembly protein TadD